MVVIKDDVPVLIYKEAELTDVEKEERVTYSMRQ